MEAKPMTIGVAGGSGAGKVRCLCPAVLKAYIYYYIFSLLQYLYYSIS